VHCQELTQFGEGLAPGVIRRRGQHLLEHVLDQVVLVFEKFDDVIRRLNKCFNHGNYSDLFGGFWSALWAARHPVITRAADY
jgi:hypothetical protein